MNFNRLLASSALYFLTASFTSADLAHARPQPNPPPSGIVVHLFGPNSIMSSIVPDLPGETAKPAPSPTPGSATTSAAATSATPGQAAAQPVTAGTQPTPTDYPEPTWGDVLHQMFIVGDPNNPPKPAPGRPSELPAAQ